MSSPPRRLLAGVSILFSSVVILSGRANAQSPSTPSHACTGSMSCPAQSHVADERLTPDERGAVGTSRPHRNWTFEIYGGDVHGSIAFNGNGVLPLSGTPFETADHEVSPALSSWYFGNGAKWVNADLANFAPESSNVMPLDTILTEGSTHRTRGLSFGARAARTISRRLELELTIQRSVGDYGLTSPTMSSLQTSANSFTAAWTTLLAGLPFASATSVLSGTTHPGSQTFSTLAINLFGRRGPYTGYLTGGAGVVLNRGDVSAQLSGTFQFVADGVSKTQTDVVVAAFSETRAEPVYIVGTGLLADLTPRTGIRIDLRFYVSGNPERTSVSATPSTSGTPSVDDLVSPSGYVFQFSAVPGTPSTLSVPLANVQTFQATGLRKQASFTIGYYVRF